MTKGCSVSRLALWLTIIGAVNWGLVGVGQLVGSETRWNLVSLLVGSWPIVEYIVYVLVGIAGVVVLFGCRCISCKDGSCAINTNQSV
jgi:uncharacterized membrane protein YuzA (DUF378 family)